MFQQIFFGKILALIFRWLRSFPNCYADEKIKITNILQPRKIQVTLASILIWSKHEDKILHSRQEHGYSLEFRHLSFMSPIKKGKFAFLCVCVETFQGNVWGWVFFFLPIKMPMIFFIGLQLENILKPSAHRWWFFMHFIVLIKAVLAYYLNACRVFRDPEMRGF